MSKKRKLLPLAALLLSETAACAVPGDVAPTPRPGATILSTQRAATPSPGVPICDPVPPPPYLTSIAATATAQAGGTTGTSPSPTPTPTATPRPLSSMHLPLQQRLRLSIVEVQGEEHAFRVEGNFPLDSVTWIASEGSLEVGAGFVRWRTERTGRGCLLQAIADAGPLGVAVAAHAIDS